jgi:transposase
VISRDRASAYAEAARMAAPKAVQVADRWHLLRNLSEALQQVLQPKHALLTQAARSVSAQPAETETSRVRSSESGAPATRVKQMREATRSRRLARYEAVMELMNRGISQAEVSRSLGIGRRTIRRWCRAGAFPERKTRKRKHCLDRYSSYPDGRWQEGCHNAAQLWRELHAQGFRRSSGIVRHWARERYGPRAHVCIRPTNTAIFVLRASSRSTAWWLLKQPEEMRAYLEELCRRSPEIASCGAVAREFMRMIRERDFAAWPGWLEAAKSTLLARFAVHLARDQNAILAALRLPWSNGTVEGHVHRLKLIKRQMYGRAKFDLLRLRVLQTA